MREINPMLDSFPYKCPAVHWICPMCFIAQSVHMPSIKGQSGCLTDPFVRTEIIRIKSSQRNQTLRVGFESYFSLSLERQRSAGEMECRCGQAYTGASVFDRQQKFCKCTACSDGLAKKRFWWHAPTELEIKRSGPTIVIGSVLMHLWISHARLPSITKKKYSKGRRMKGNISNTPPLSLSLSLFSLLSSLSNLLRWPGSASQRYPRRLSVHVRWHCHVYMWTRDSHERQPCISLSCRRAMVCSTSSMYRWGVYSLTKFKLLGNVVSAITAVVDLEESWLCHW